MSPLLARAHSIHKEDVQKAQTSSKLVLDAVEAVDTGLYRCAASNRWGADLSDPLQLLVKGSHRNSTNTNQ